jgi:hypothetical protein
MIRAARIDANQPEIIKALRACGATVQPLHTVGAGVPDLLVGYRGKNYLLEIKDSSKPPSARRLTEDQIIWHVAWRGRVTIVTTINEALDAIGATR